MQQNDRTNEKTILATIKKTFRLSFQTMQK